MANTAIMVLQWCKETKNVGFFNKTHRVIAEKLVSAKHKVQIPAGCEQDAAWATKLSKDYEMAIKAQQAELVKHRRNQSKDEQCNTLIA